MIMGESLREQALSSQPSGARRESGGDGKEPHCGGLGDVEAHERRAVVVFEEVTGAAVESEGEVIVRDAVEDERDLFDQAGVAAEAEQRVDAGGFEVEVERDLLTCVSNQ